MLKSILHIVVWVGLVTTMWATVIPVHAAIDNATSPFVDDSDTGGADKIAVPGAKDDTNTKDAVVNVVKGAVNRVLGILGFIALIMLLYGGFLMVTAAGEDDKYKKGLTILKQAAFGLILIWVARFILSLVFRLINITASNAGGSAGTDT